MRAAILLTLLLLSPVGAALASDVVYYYGEVVLFGRGISAPPTAHIGSAVVYEVEVLAVGQGEELSISIPHYNKVRVSGPNLTFLFSGEEEAYQGFHRIKPVMVKVSQEIEGVYVEKGREVVSTVAAEVGGNITAIFRGEEVSGTWDDKLNSWIIELNDTLLQVTSNNTATVFEEALSEGGDNLTLSLDNKVYKLVKLRLSQGKLIYELVGPTVKSLGEFREIPLAEMDWSWTYLWYNSGSESFLVRARILGPMKYVYFTPECPECTVNASSGETTFVFDGTLRASINGEIRAPDSALTGSYVNATFVVGEADQVNVLLPSGEGLIYRPGNHSIPLSVRFYVPPVTGEVESRFFLTWFASGRAFGISKQIKLERAVSAELLNGSEVILIQGKGEVQVVVENYSPNPVKVVNMRMTVSEGTRTYQLIFPVDVDVYRDHSKLIALPLSIKPGVYRAFLEAEIEDLVTRRNVTLPIGELLVRSIGELPVKVNLTFSPLVPNVGDEVVLKVLIKPNIEVKDVAIKVRSEPGLKSLNRTSVKLDKVKSDIVEEFKFKAVDPGTSKVIVQVDYRLPDGRAGSVRDQVSVPVGGVRGKVFVNSNVSKVFVGQEFPLVVMVKDCEGEAEVHLPRWVKVVRVNGEVEGNVVKFNAPGDLYMTLSVEKPGNYTIPTYVAVNGSIIPTNPVRVEVSGPMGEKEKRSLLSKVAELKRRFKTVKEALSSKEAEAVDRLERMFSELDEALNSGNVRRAESLISEIDKEISKLEGKISEAGILKNLMSYVLIGFVLAVIAAMVIILKFRGKERLETP